jgi:hypothetical protein
MDPGCFKSKVDAHLIQIKTQLRSTGSKEIVDVSGNWKTGKKGPLGTDRYTLVDATAKGASVAVVVDGRDAGKVVYVKVKPPGAPAARSSWEEDQRQRREAEAKRKAKAEKELSVRVKILEAIRAKITGGGLARGDVQAILATVLAGGRAEWAPLAKLHGVAFRDEWSAGDALVKALPKMGELEFTRLVIEASVADDLREYYQDRAPAKLNDLAKRFKVDFAKIRTDAEAEGGTRREIEKSPAAAPTAKKAAAKKSTAAKKKIPSAKKRATKKSSKR